MLLSFHLTNPKGFISEPKCVCSLRCYSSPSLAIFRLQKGAVGTWLLLFFFPVSHPTCRIRTRCTFNTNALCLQGKCTHSTYTPNVKYTFPLKPFEYRRSFDFLNAIYRWRCLWAWENEWIGEKSLFQTFGDWVEMNKYAGIFYFWYANALHMSHIRCRLLSISGWRVAIHEIRLFYTSFFFHFSLYIPESVLGTCFWTAPDNAHNVP